MKKVAFNKPKKAATADADQWVQSNQPLDQGRAAVRDDRPHPMEAMKRFTVDVPVELHRRIKSQCAMRGMKMADMLRELLDREFPES